MAFRYHSLSALTVSSVALVCVWQCAVAAADPLFDIPFNPVSRCQYSVRDVAFVNVHQHPWQLQLVRPAGTTESQFAEWNRELRDRLRRSNLGHIWLDVDSVQAIRLTDAVQRQRGSPPDKRVDNLPSLAIQGPGDILIPVVDTANSSPTLTKQLDRLLSSPRRDEILNYLVDSLCVVVLVESGDNAKDAAARETVAAAVERTDRQMWTLEKPVDQGPAVVTVAPSERADESWLISSLGIDRQNLPAVAIVFGQGRRLGDVLYENNLTVEKIAGRASICGSDCECSLNRQWLYGQPMIHVWSTELERAAEQSLTFDPNSAIVIAEVSQIIQKVANRLDGSRPVDLGGGLVIPDLDPIDPDSDEPDAGEQDAGENSAKPAPLAEPATIESRKTQNQPSDSASSSTEGVTRQSSATDMNGSAVDVPWFLIVGLGIVLLVLVVLVSWRVV